MPNPLNLPNPIEGIVTSSFGERISPLQNDTVEFHTGLDIAAPKGTGVIAVGNGTVTEVRYSSTYGNIVKYKISDDIEIMYAHLDESLVKPGDIVKIGEVIAKSGNTGLSTGAHLHYSIYIKGELSDPMEYVNLPVSDDVDKEYEYRSGGSH